VNVLLGTTEGSSFLHAEGFKMDSIATRDSRSEVRGLGLKEWISFLSILGVVAYGALVISGAVWSM